MTKVETRRMISTKAVFALMFYLVMPVVVIYIIITTYPMLSSQRYVNMLYWIIPFSILLVILSQWSIMYPKGDTRRFYLNLCYVVAAMLWLFGFLGGGLVITDYWGEYQFSIHLWKYILVIIAVAVFNSIYYYLEWKVYRGDIISDS